VKVLALPTVAPESSSRVGSVVEAKYRIVKVIGRGGMGTVYEAVHTGIGKRVALKFLEGHASPDTQARARFLREAQTASLVESPHVVHIFDSGWSEDGVPFMVLELLRGQDLRSLLRIEGRLGIDQAISIAEQTLRALIQTHAAGIVHRDLKPENIFLCEIDGAEPLVKVLDFGISKNTRPEEQLDTLTHQGAVLGTAYYMSPEQARGEPDVDARSDIYSLGAIVYEMISGRPPHLGNVHHAVLVDICTRDAPDVRLLAPQVSEELAHVIARALRRERGERFTSAQSFLDALGPFSSVRTISNGSQATATRVSEPSIQPSVRSDSSSASRGSQRSGKVVAFSLLSALVLAATGIIIVHKWLKSERSHERAALWQAASSHGPASPTPSATAVASTVLPTAQSATSATSASPTKDAPRAELHRSGAATKSSVRSPGRLEHSDPGELKLNTTMP
jgi:serine/threonine-protein kinase